MKARPWRACRRGRRAASVALAGAVLVGSSSAFGLTRGQQWFVDNGIQVAGVISNPAGGNPFHLSTYQSMGYTTQTWEWVTDSSQLSMSWGRWVTQSSNLPPVGGESGAMGNLKHLNLGSVGADEPNLNDSAVRDQQVAFFNSTHANSTFNNVLLWANNFGGQVNDTALGDFISRAQPDMISFDTYPYAPSVQPAGGSPTNWYGDFRRYRQWGMDTNTPVGFYRQTYASPTGEPQTRAVSQSELSLQTFAGLAFNAKFMTDFTYNFNGNTMFSGGGDNVITALGTAAQTMNAEVKKLGPALVKLKPVADQTTPYYTSSMMFIRGKNTNASTYNAAPNSFVVDPQNSAYTDWVQGRNDPYMLEPTTATNLGTKNSGLPGDVIVSWFTPMDESFDGAWTNEKYFMVVNGLADMNGTATETRQSITLNFDFGASGVTQLQRLNRSTGLVEDVNLSPLGGSQYSLSLTLDGGRGDLFKFKDGAPFVGIQSATTGILYWDGDGVASGNNLTTGAGLGGSGTWDTTAKWHDGFSELAWSAGSDAIFYGTAGTVTLAAAQSVNSLRFRTNGYRLTGSTLTMVGATATVDAGVTATIASAVTGNAGLVKNGTGTLNLALANSYSGGTTINDGVLGIVSSSLGMNPSSPQTNVTINNGATLRFNLNGLSLTVNRQFLLGSGGGVIDTNGNFDTIAGMISGTSLTKTGAGTLVLSNTSNSYSGTTVNGGILQVSADGNLGAVPGSLTANITLDGGTLQFGANFDISNNRAIVMSASGGTIDTQSFSNPTGYNPTNGFQGGDLTKIGSGTFFASATTVGFNTLWTGNLIIKQGIWKIVATDGLPINPTSGGLRPAQVTLDGGTWQIGATISASQSNRGITVAAGGGTIDTQGFNLTWPGPVAGTVATATLTKMGSGILTLKSSGTASSYVGKVNVAEGTLQLDGGTSMGDLAAMNVVDVAGAALSVTGSETIGSLAGGGVNGGNVTLGGITLTTGGNNGSTTFGGVISGGSGKVVKAGSGTMVLTGANTYGAGTTISAGTLQVGNGGTTGSVTGSVTDNGVLKFNRSDSITFSGSVSGSGGMTQAGPGTLALSGSNSYGGVTSVLGGMLVAGSANLGSGGAGNDVVLDGGTLKTSGVINSNRKITIGAGGGTIDSGGFDSSWGALDPGNFTKAGAGKVGVTGIDALGVTVNAGTLALKNRATTGGKRIARMTSLSIAGSAALDLNDNDLVVNGGSFSAVQALVFSGYRSGVDSAARGIISTTGQNAGGTTILALFNNALFGVTDYPFGSGQTISANAIVGKYTYIGDTDWDGQVTPQDYTAIDANLGATGLDPGVAWFSGDTNFDGNIDPSDYTGVDAALGLGVGNPLSAQGLAAVPEPAGLGALVSVGMLLARRRRGRGRR